MTQVKTQNTASKPTRSKVKGTIEQGCFPQAVRLIDTDGAVILATAITQIELCDPERDLGACCRLDTDMPRYVIAGREDPFFDTRLPQDLLHANWGWHGTCLVKLDARGLDLTGAAAVSEPQHTIADYIAAARAIEARSAQPEQPVEVVLLEVPVARSRLCRSRELPAGVMQLSFLAGVTA